MILRSILASALLAAAVCGASMNEQKDKQMPMFQSVDPSKATLVGSGEGKEYCAVCGMNLVKFYKTNHVWNGKQVASLHCLYELTEGKIPSDAQVVDTKNLNLIDVNKAFYVVGSKVKGTMTRNSKYAFSTEADAKEFQAENGGEIVNFAKAYEIAGQDFEGDNKMIKAKREGGVYAHGKEFYETNCAKTEAKSFKAISELKAHLKKTCDAKGASKAPEYDKHLQAAALYLWDAPANLGSSDKNAKVKKPEKIVVPEGAKCPVCGMLVGKNPNWAAMIEIQGGENLYFDGVKDMMKYYFQKGKSFDKIYVTDYYKLHKIDAKSAFFVLGSNVLGPMGDELIPFESESAAKTFAKDHGGKSVLKFDEIQESVIEGL
mgnify:FL=1